MQSRLEKMGLGIAAALRTQSILHTGKHQRTVSPEETFSGLTHSLSQFESPGAGAELCLSLVSSGVALRLDLSAHSSAPTTSTCALPHPEPSL